MVNNPVVWFIVDGKELVQSLKQLAREFHLKFISCYDYLSLETMLQEADTPDIVILGLGQDVRSWSFRHLNINWFGITDFFGYIPAVDIISAIKEKDIKPTFLVLQMWLGTGIKSDNTPWDEKIDMDTLLVRMEEWGERQI